MKHLDQLNIDRDRLQLIVSRHDPRLELSAEQIARQLQLPLLDVIPERRRELSAAVNQGALLSARTKRRPYVQAVERLVNRLLAEHHPDIDLPVQTSANRPASPLAPLMQRIGEIEQLPNDHHGPPSRHAWQSRRVRDQRVRRPEELARTSICSAASKNWAPEPGRWSRAAIAQFVMMELDSHIRLHSVPVNEQEAKQVASA